MFKKRKIPVTFILAAVITFVIRITLYREDCNLLVLSVTFFVILLLVKGSRWLVNRYISIIK